MGMHSRCYTIHGLRSDAVVCGANFAFFFEGTPRSKLKLYHGQEQLSPADTMLATTIAKSASMVGKLHSPLFSHMQMWRNSCPADVGITSISSSSDDYESNRRVDGTDARCWSEGIQVRQYLELHSQVSSVSSILALYISIFSILAKDGVFGFYRGVFVSLVSSVVCRSHRSDGTAPPQVRVMPAQWCTFVTYECVKDAILRYQEANCSSHELE